MKELINHTGLYSLCWILFYIGLGVICYILDRQYVQGFYQSVSNMFRKDPIDKPMGIVYGQKTARKFLIATIVSTIQSFGLFFFTGFHSNPFVELMLWLVEIPAMVIGFGLGSWLYPIVWEKRSKFFGAMDKIDEVIEERQEKMKTGSKSPTEPVVVPETKPEPQPVTVQKPELTPEERIRAYGRGEKIS